MKKIFIDTKYNTESSDIKQPISIAMIELDTGEYKYFEFSDYYKEGCDQNAIENILPALVFPDNKKVSISYGITQLFNWIETLGKCMIIGESIDDYETINHYFINNSNESFFVYIQDFLASELDVSTEETLAVVIEHFNKIKNIHFEFHNSNPYNALDDAQAILRSYQSIMKDPLLKRNFKNI